jgi:type II secretory pathway pseudopilin PulG
MRVRQRGITVVELIVASLILGLLGLLTVVLFRTGASGWKKLEAQSGLLADYEVFNEKLSREVQRSNFGSAYAADTPDDTGTTLAFLSAMDDNGNFALDTGPGPPAPTYEPEWQKYLVFYWDKPARRIYLNEVKLAAGSPEVNTPVPIEMYSAGTGNINDYRTGGRLLMTDVDNCRFELDNFMLTVEVGASKRRYGDEQPETLNMVNSVGFRN